MSFGEKVKETYNWIVEKRMALREFPWYRTLERVVRVGVIAGVSVFVAQYLGLNVSFKLALAAGAFAGLDKIKNEVQELFRNKENLGCFFTGVPL